MAGSVKRAISLPQEQDSKLLEIARKRGTGYSALVQAAIRLFLRVQEERELADAYKRFYSDAANHKRTSEAVADLQALSSDVWP